MNPVPDSGQLPRATRLTTEREAELYRTVLDELVRSGYESLTMDAVAQKARTSKATIYRQWQGKPGLVAAALRHLKPDGADRDTGSLRGDLVAVCEEIGRFACEHAQLLAAVSHGVSSDPELAAAVRECVIEPNSGKLAPVLDRAVARGEVDPDNPAISYVPTLFIQTVASRETLEGRPVDTAYLIDLVDAVILPALTAQPSSRTSAASRPKARPHDRKRS
jgi:AcrR family transcriptional regulator